MLEAWLQLCVCLCSGWERLAELSHVDCRVIIRIAGLLNPGGYSESREQYFC